MPPREYLTPPEFDPRSIAIDGDDEDPRPYERPAPTVRRVHVEPKRSRTVASATDAQYQDRDSRYKALWLGFWVGLVAVPLLIGYLIVNGIPL